MPASNEKIVLAWDLDDTLLRYNPYEYASDWYSLSGDSLSTLLDQLSKRCNTLGVKFHCAIATHRSARARPSQHQFDYMASDMRKVLQILAPYMPTFTIDGHQGKFVASQNSQGVFALPLERSAGVVDITHALHSAPIQFLHETDRRHLNKNRSLSLIAQYYNVESSDIILIDDRKKNCTDAVAKRFRTIHFSVDEYKRYAQQMIFDELKKDLWQQIVSILKYQQQFSFDTYYYHLELPKSQPQVNVTPVAPLKQTRWHWFSSWRAGHRH